MIKFKRSKKEWFLYCILGIGFIASMLFVKGNYRFYKETIVKVVEVEQIEQKESIDFLNNVEDVYIQKLIVQVKNGEHVGKQMELENSYSDSSAYDNHYRKGDTLFVATENALEQTLTGKITGVKRDHYIVLIAWIFIVFIILVGKKKGLYSIISLALNIVLFSFALDLYLKGVNLLLICSLIVIAFSVFSLFLVSGNNKKTYGAVIATVIGTFTSLFIAFIVMRITNEKGMRYEEMQFITHPPFEIFMAEILVGSLGAIMDISITMSSSIFELYAKNNEISPKALIASGKEIGKDIMGTMINVLFFVYVSGSIPMLLLYLKNGAEIGYTFSMNLSLEMVRALTGSIGIVLTIPIALYISVFLLKERRVKA